MADLEYTAYHDFLLKQKQSFQRLKKLTREESEAISLFSILPQNSLKNRYRNVLPGNHALVYLEHPSSKTGYINANYVWGTGPRPEKVAFIATQAPLRNICEDFWLMIYEQKSPVIVMLTRFIEGNKTKCFKYWGGTDPHIYGSVQVSLLSYKKNFDLEHRKFQIEILDSEKEPFVVDHFQYTGWSDHSVPNNTQGLRQILTEIEDVDGPVTVHCSAGIGRTGTLIAISLLLQQIQSDTVIQDLNPAEMVEAMRRQRPNMVQTTGQFEFILKFLRDHINELRGESRRFDWTMSIGLPISKDELTSEDRYFSVSQEDVLVLSE